MHAHTPRPRHASTETPPHLAPSPARYLELHMLSRVVFVLALSARHVSVISCSHALIPGSVSQSIQYSALFQGFPGIPPCLAMGINLDLNVPVRVSLLEVSLVAYCQMGARERGSVGGVACRFLPNLPTDVLAPCALFVCLWWLCQTSKPVVKATACNRQALFVFVFGCFARLWSCSCVLGYSPP